MLTSDSQTTLTAVTRSGVPEFATHGGDFLRGEISETLLDGQFRFGVGVTPARRTVRAVLETANRGIINLRGPLATPFAPSVQGLRGREGCNCGGVQGRGSKYRFCGVYKQNSTNPRPGATPDTTRPQEIPGVSTSLVYFLVAGARFELATFGL